MDDIMVSISCLAYNHEKYIRQALEGFVNQKTNFKFEVLVHDDASTDGTADIIREFEEKYPDIIKPIYQTENQYSKKVGIQKTYQCPRAKGKYMAFCEGDDYWCCDTKLQEQFDIMERNPDVVLCTHKVAEINEQGSLQNITYPDVKRNIRAGLFSSEDFVNFLLNYKYPFQTSSYFVKTSLMLDMNNSNADFLKLHPAGDSRVLWYCSVKGSMYYIDKIYSCYRKGSSGSWTSKMKNEQYRLGYYKKEVSAYKAFDAYTKYKYSELIQNLIITLEGHILFLLGDTKTLLTPRYRKFVKKLSFKQKVRYILKVYFNSIFSLIIKVKRREV